MKRDGPVVSTTAAGNLRILIPNRHLGKADPSVIESLKRTALRHFQIAETNRPGVSVLLIELRTIPGKPTRRRDHRTPVVAPTECPEVDDEGGMSEYHHLGYEWP
jgi:hypothetical protein